MKIERLTNWLACRKKLMNAFIRGVHLIPDKNNKKKKILAILAICTVNALFVATNFQKRISPYSFDAANTTSPAEHFLIK